MCKANQRKRILSKVKKKIKIKINKKFSELKTCVFCCLPLSTAVQ